MNLDELVVTIALDGELILSLNGGVASVPAKEAEPVIQRLRRLLAPGDSVPAATAVPNGVAKPRGHQPPKPTLNPHSREAEVLRAANDMPDDVPWTSNQLQACGGFDREVTSAVYGLTQKKLLAKVDGGGHPGFPYRYQITRTGKGVADKLPQVRRPAPIAAGPDRVAEVRATTSVNPTVAEAPGPLV